MKKNLATACAVLLLLLVATAGAWASAINQVTVSASANGGVRFTDTGSSITFTFTGTAAQCGHANCVSGNAIFEPSGALAQYWMWITGGPISLTGGPSDFAVNMGSSTVWVEVKLPGSDLMTTLDLTTLSGGLHNTPTFDGVFNTMSATSLFAPEFPANSTGEVDFTVHLGSNLSLIKPGHSMGGSVSSGELVPAVPEPASLALVGTGVLGIAGVIRRKMKK